MNEVTTDESNDVVFMKVSGPKSFKNLFSHEHKATSDTKNAIAEISSSSPPMDSEQKRDKQHKDQSSKSKTDGNGATKRNDWDMFAEQDIDSNFDVNWTKQEKKKAMHYIYDFHSITESEYNCCEQNDCG